MFRTISSLTWSMNSVKNGSVHLMILNHENMMVFRIKSMRPVLTKTKDSQETVLLACQFSDPSMGRKEAEALMHGLLLGKDSVQGQLHAAILDYRPSILSAFHQSLLTYLQEYAVYFENPKNNHTDPQSNLSPKVGDFVCYKDGGNELILE